MTVLKNPALTGGDSLSAGRQVRLSRVEKGMVDIRSFTPPSQAGIALAVRV